MDISPEQMEIYRQSARARDAEHRRKVEERRQRAMQLAPRAAQLLKEEFGATRVVLFGSLLHPELYHLRSNIDLAVWDIQHYFRAVSHLLDLDAEIDFDLVPFEDARPSLQQVIMREGVDL